MRRLLVFLAVLLLALTGCGSANDEAPQAAGSQGGAFPVTIKNKYGDTVVKQAPQRVVTVGLVEQDALLALGVVPAATTEWFGEKPGALFPWAKAKLADHDNAAVPQHPEFKGKPALMASPYEGYFIYGTQDPRSRLLTDFGFVLPAGLDKAIGDKFGANISAERISLLDQQALVWFPTKGGTAKLKADPLYKNLKVRTEGRDVFVEEDYDDQLYGATSFVSVLSLPIVLDKLVPKLAAAVDGNPVTNA
jgi:ABC-type Fe3+-hydroxamate transport system substrate-binding protein